MKILITKQRPLSFPSGETTHLFGIAREMRKLGAEIFMMPVSKEPTSPALWPSEYVHDVRPFGLHRLFDGFPLSRAAANFIGMTPVDVVLSWEYETAYLRAFSRARNYILGVIAGAPFGLLKRKTQKDPVRALAYHLFQFRQLRQADVIFAPSHDAQNELAQAFGISLQKIVVTPLSADSVFKPAAAPKTGPVRAIIFSGFLEPIKGIFDAIDALGQVARQGAGDWTLEIAGWGDIEAVRAAARTAGIENRVQFLGKLDRPALAEALSNADLALLPSHIETFGLSIVEAQACGLPVVSYATASIPEVVVANETALLVPPFDRSALAAAVLQLLKDPERARNMGQRAAEHVRLKFSWERTAQLMLSHLEHMRRSM